MRLSEGVIVLRQNGVLVLRQNGRAIDTGLTLLCILSLELPIRCYSARLPGAGKKRQYIHHSMRDQANA